MQYAPPKPANSWLDSTVDATTRHRLRMRQPPGRADPRRAIGGVNPLRGNDSLVMDNRQNPIGDVGDTARGRSHHHPRVSRTEEPQSSRPGDSLPSFGGERE